MADPVVERDEVRGQIAGALDRGASLARLVVGGFAVTVVLLLVVLGGIIGITLDTNLAVRDREVLEDRNAELEELNADHEAVEVLATDWIIYLAGQLAAAGVQPPEIVLRPGAQGPPEEEP